MTIESIAGLPPFWSTTPVGGQLCVRKLSKGSAMVGVIHFDDDTRIHADRGYLLIHAPQGIRLAQMPVADSLPEELSSSNLDEVLRATVWPRTNRPEAWVVRFIEALPDSNTWVVYGPSDFPQPPGSPDHQWFEVTRSGTTQPLKAPFQANGMTMAQLLKRPVWPAPDGQTYSFPTLQPEWRGHMHRLHQLLADVGGQRATADDTLNLIRKDPDLAQLLFSRPDPDYCRFLEALRVAGDLVVDQPMTVEQFKHREEVAERCLAQVLGLETHGSGATRPKTPGRR